MELITLLRPIYDINNETCGLTYVRVNKNKFSNPIKEIKSNRYIAYNLIHQLLQTDRIDIVEYQDYISIIDIANELNHGYA